MISKKRIVKDLNELAKIGKTGNGVTRLTYSEEENKAHNYAKKVMKIMGLEVSADSFGNLHGRLNGESSTPLSMGSHLDTVRNGGNYDGVAGIVSGIEVLRCIKESGSRLSHPIELIVFRGEESARFGRSCIGSSLLLGKISKKDLDKLSDGKVTLRNAMQSCGYNPVSQPIDASKIKTYMELHIEQGCVLEKKKIPVGIVTGIAAPVRYKIHVYGRRGHSGATPMNMRIDAVDAVAEMIGKREEILMKSHSEGKATVATIGNVMVPSGSMNTIAGEVRFYLDIRDINIKDRDDVENIILKAFDGIAKKRGVKVVYELSERKEPVMLPANMQKAIESSCKKLKIRYCFMPSGAGHDAMNFAYAGIPTGMIFVPSRDGISHAPDEYTNLDDIAAGAEVLLETIKLLQSE